MLTPKRAHVFRQIEFIRPVRQARAADHRHAGRRRAEPYSVRAAADYAEHELLEAANFFNVHFAGKSFDAVRRTLAT